MFEQDYIMRLIKQFIRALLKFTFDIDTDSPTVDLLEAEQKCTAGELIAMLDDDKIREAENRLNSVIDVENAEDLKMAIIFYSYLSEKDNDYLERNGLTEDDIMAGLQDIAVKYGMKDFVDMF